MIKGLYIHIPFCHTICSYCDFSKMVAGEALNQQYMSVLLEEIAEARPKLQSLETIYIGGGTPTRLTLQEMSTFLTALNELVPSKNLREFSMEANPEDINEAYAFMLKTKGINRISLGAQTMDNHLLKTLNRSHQKEDLFKAVNILRKTGFDNINIDMIYGIPGQTLALLVEDINTLLMLGPEHISYYSLILEEHTLLYHQIKNNLTTLPDEDQVADFGDLVNQRLKEMGYERYEISNFAKPGKRSRHNLLYWQLEPYLGVGLNASSQFDDLRYKNKGAIRQYLKDFRVKETEIFEAEKEYLLMGLRKIEGISKKAFRQRFQRDVFAYFPKLSSHLETGLLIEAGDILRFSQRGIDLANRVYLDII